ncbi:MAG: helix-turn-helix domain-containing protein [Candidatus Dojkabacteria bacterium]|jgi:DNA-binding XRE family transcriptional regulator
MGKGKLIPWEVLEKENFTEEQLKRIHKESEKRIALRRLKEARKKMGISQYELATRSGIPRSAISEIESGKRNVSIAKLTKLADALNTDLEIDFVKRK